MLKFLDNYQPQAYALLRITAGFMFLSHGLQKLFNFPIDFPWPLSPMTTTAGGIELVAGLLIIFGFLTRPAAFIASGMTAVGYWLSHGTQSFLPIANGGEIIALYSFIFLFIATKGAGIWSIDKES